MKIITFYSDSHSDIYHDFFLRSCQKYLSNHKLIVKKIEQISPTGEFGSEGFDYTTIEKIKFIIENINLNDEEPLIYADCDIQFFNDIEYELKDNDILFQHDYHINNYCTGFFIAKQNQNVLDFFLKVKERFLNTIDGIINDQNVVNYIFREGYDKIKKNLLPSNKYWNCAFSTGGALWTGQELVVPPTIIMHHANFTLGVKNKYLLLEKVKNYMINL